MVESAVDYLCAGTVVMCVCVAIVLLALLLCVYFPLIEVVTKHPPLLLCHTPSNTHACLCPRMTHSLSLAATLRSVFLEFDESLV